MDVQLTVTEATQASAVTHARGPHFQQLKAAILATFAPPQASKAQQ